MTPTMAADDKKKEPEDGAEGKKKGLPLVPIIVVTAMLIGEAAIVAGMFMFLGGPTEVQADPAVADKLAEGEKPVTLPVLARKFQNTRSGESLLYDVEVFATTRKKHEEEAKALLEEKQAAIGFEVMVLFRKAEPAFLREASLPDDDPPDPLRGAGRRRQRARQRGAVFRRRDSGEVYGVRGVLREREVTKGKRERGTKSKVLPRHPPSFSADFVAFSLFPSFPSTPRGLRP